MLLLSTSIFSDHRLEPAGDSLMNPRGERGFVIEPGIDERLIGLGDRYQCLDEIGIANALIRARTAGKSKA
jgi:hypothetical protein